MSKYLLLGFFVFAFISGCTTIKQTETLAIQGDAKAQYDLGFKYQNGIDVPKDIRKAIYWYQLSASQGNSWSKNNLLKIQCSNLINQDGSIGKLEGLKQAISENNKQLVNKYFYCGYPISSKLDSYPLVYWSGFYNQKDMAIFLDSNGINSPSYQQGLSDGHQDRINLALKLLIASFFVENIGDESNLFIALIHEGAAMAKTKALIQLLTESFPHKSNTEIQLAARVLNSKLSVYNFNKSMLRSAFKEELNKVSPGFGDISSFIYGVTERLKGGYSSPIEE